MARTANLQCNIPDPQKAALLRLQKESEFHTGRSLGSLVSEAIAEHFGIQPDGHYGFPPRPVRERPERPERPESTGADQ